MRIVAFDHFFDQDLDAISAVLTTQDELIRIDYRRLRRLAGQCFSAEAFTGLQAAYQPTEDHAWLKFGPIAESFAERLMAAYNPDVFVSPSDTFFYLRPVIESLQSLGVPCVVVQKETTISPMVFHEHSVEVGRFTPFISDLMTVCSERNKAFWVRSGAESSTVIVTGQPRFDTYVTSQVTPRAPSTLLYLSFDDVAYLPADRGWTSPYNWRTFREEVERVIGSLSPTCFRVIAKRHPQQSDQGDWLGSSVSWASSSADTRDLIVKADIVVGFQTTALFEAMAADKQIVYPAWGETFQKHRDLLIPFHELEGALVHAKSAVDLRRALTLRTGTWDPDIRKRVIEENLGPIDGHASARVVALLRGLSRADVRAPSVKQPGLFSVVIVKSSELLLRFASIISPRMRRRCRPWIKIRQQELRELAKLRKLGCLRR
jgi:hypothetical protein